MIDRRRFVVAAAALCLLASPVFAAAPAAFASANFAAANESGAPVLVHINATWCPTCRAQIPIITTLLDEPRFKKVKAFSVDYDSEKPVMRQLNAPDRSTIIVFKGGKEVARAVGDTDKAKIEALLAKAV